MIVTLTKNLCLYVFFGNRVIRKMFCGKSRRGSTIILLMHTQFHLISNDFNLLLMTLLFKSLLKPTTDSDPP